MVEPSDDPLPDLKRVAFDERRRIASRRNTADLLFLAGLVTGGPLLSLGGRARLGLFVLLVGASASALYRFARSSLPAALLIGGLGSAAVAVAVTDSPSGAAEDAHVGEAARSAYVTALQPDLDAEGGLVEARGPGQITVWFQLPAVGEAGCGAYPDPAVRRHLAELGFVRVVVATRIEGAGICSFKP